MSGVAGTSNAGDQCRLKKAPSSVGQQQSSSQLGVRAVDVEHLIRDRIAMLTGGRDKHGRPIIVFPSRDNAERTTIDEIHMLLKYLYTIPRDDVKQNGFVVILDMRRGMTWNASKPILKALQDHFQGHVHAVYIIKPEKFWEKQRLNFNSAKYKFEVLVIAADNLHSIIDRSQLTHDFDGSLTYDHDEWLEFRVHVENIISPSLDVLRAFELARNEMENGELPVDVDTAKKCLDEHNRLRKRLLDMPVEQLEMEAQRLLSRLPQHQTNGSQACSISTSSIFNPDFSNSAPHILQLIDKMRSTKDELLNVWQQRKNRLDQCFQLKLFEQDADKMFEWIKQHVDVFLASFTNIGDSHHSALLATREHDEFAKAAMNTYVNISHIMRVAQRLLEAGHYASARIQSVTTKLDAHWQMFSKALHMRSEVLAISVDFHSRAEQYFGNHERWQHDCAVDTLGPDGNVQQLEAAICDHQQLCKSINDIYEQAMSAGKSLVSTLKMNPSENGRDGLMGIAAMSSKEQQTARQTAECSQHVVSIMQRIIQQQRNIESVAQQRRIQLHHRLAVMHFEQDVRLVIDWLDHHGQVYLRKNTGIGKTLQRAQQLHKSQLNFENVAKNTYTNADKLLAAAQELRATGSPDTEQVYHIAQQLQSRVNEFTAQVATRKHLLNVSVLFHTHYKEMLNWYEQLAADQSCTEVVPESSSACEQVQEKWLARAEATMQAYATCISEGQQLNALLRQQEQTESCNNAESVACVDNMLANIETRQQTQAEVFQRQRLAIQLAGRFRRLEDDVNIIMSQLEGWREDMRQMAIDLSPNKAEQVMPMHQENINHVKAAMHEIVKHAQEPIRMLETSGLTLVTSNGQPVLNAVVDLTDKAKQLERDVMKVAEETQRRLEQANQLGRLQSMAAHVVTWVTNEEHVLRATACIPASLEEAVRIQAEHKDFQIAVEKTNEQAVALNERAEQMLACNHYDPGRVRALAEDVLLRWRRLVLLTEERHKLLCAAVPYFKTLKQMKPVLETLQNQYQMEQDMCAQFVRCTEDNITDKVEFMSHQLDNHRNKKERLLKGCTYTRKTGETYLKYVRRMAPMAESQAGAVEQQILDALDQLRQQENLVLELWAKRKRQFDECHKFVLLEASAKQRLDWLLQTGELYLSSRPSGRVTKDQAQQLLADHETFKQKAKEQRDKVSIFLGLGASACDEPEETRSKHLHDIKKCMETVQQRYNDFSQRCERWEKRLRAELGQANLTPDRELSLDRQQHDPTLAAKIRDAATEFDDSRRRSARKKELVNAVNHYIMTELLNTERTYVQDLRLCIDEYLQPLLSTDSPLVNEALRQKQAALFSNIKQIYTFHNDTFLRELERYAEIAEDVGHCFVTWAETLQKLYVTYCKNKDLNKGILAQPDVEAYSSAVQKSRGLALPLQAYLIKPVQRITKYQLLLKDLCSCCADQSLSSASSSTSSSTAGSNSIDEHQGGTVVNEIEEALAVMLNVPKRANDMIHLNMLDGCPDVDTFGDVLMQDSFFVWEPKHLIKKGRERQVFLFDVCVVFSKKVIEPMGRVKYVYKHRLTLAEINVSEHIEGDESKFGLWTGAVPSNELRTVMKAPDHKVKVAWVKKLRELIGQRRFHFAMSELPCESKASTADDVSNRSFANTDAESVSSKTADGSELPPDRSSFVSTASSEADPLTGGGEQLLSTALDADPTSCQGRVVHLLADYVVHNPDDTQTQLHKSDRLLVVNTRPADVANSAVNLCQVRLVDGAADSNTFLVPTHLLALVSTSGKQTTTTQSGALPDTSNSALDVFKKKNIRRFFSSRSEHKRQASDASATVVEESSKRPQQQQHKLSAPQPTPTATAAQPSQQQSDSTAQAQHATALTASCSVNSTAAAAAVDSFDMSIPPPMDSIQTDKLELNGQQTDVDNTVVSGEVPVDCVQQLSVDDEQAASASSAQEDGSTEDQPDPDAPPKPSPQEAAKQKRHYVLAELVETEKDYVTDLGSIVNGYMEVIKSMQLPEDIAGRDKIVFANIQQIYEFHRDTFLNELTKCLEDYTFAGRAFVKYERRLHMYVVYCQNKPKSEYLLAQDNIEQFFLEVKKNLPPEIKTRLSIADLLIKPVQRIMKYQLLLKDIKKQTVRAEQDMEWLDKGLHIMHVVPKECDDMMQVGRLQGFDGKITAQGKLLLQDNLLVYENQPGAAKAAKERRLFLFEQSIIIADYIRPKNDFSNPNYIYKSHFLVNKMAMEPTVPDEPLKFVLRSSDPAVGTSFIVQAKDADDKERWLEQINKILNHQQMFLQMIQQPQAAMPGANTNSASKNPNGAPAGAKDDKASSKAKFMTKMFGGDKKKDDSSTDAPPKSSGRKFFGKK